MEDFHGVEEKAFVVDEVNNVIKELPVLLCRRTALAFTLLPLVTGIIQAMVAITNQGSTTYKYDSKTMYIIVNVFGLAI
ncbi:hypothetical protein HDV06_004094 [Boothiomyces sp. JEL0866]|nr:hypothetical protein HDV06_004094 [Boothiomyces sp. JEL0866]